MNSSCVIKNNIFYSFTSNIANIVDPELPKTSSARPFDDPSEPIYTDPSLFERSRSLRSTLASHAGQKLKM